MSQARPKSVMPAAALENLGAVRQQILDAAAGRMPERLVQVTMALAVRAARDDTGLTEALPDGVGDLVRDMLLDLAQQKWKPDTVLKLRPSRT